MKTPLERTVSRVSNINTTGLTRGNELDRYGLCHHIALVANDMRMVPARIRKAHACGVHMRPAFGIVPFVGGHSPGGGLPSDFDVRDFDVSTDGREVVLERVQERADVVLMDLSGR